MMNGNRSVWLVANSASGSNDAAAIERLREGFAHAGIQLARITGFPEEGLPSALELAAAGIEYVAVFAGDGTINALVTSLYGWEGSVLILPGGTMNLLYRRLHGDRDLQEVLDAFGAGKVRLCRPGVIRSQYGDGLAGVMAGPGTAWNDVREAMRNVDVVGLASSAVQAIGESVAAPMIACSTPRLGRVEGYPLVVLTPADDGFAVDAYHAETAGEYLAQGVALLKRDFREGPSDRLGHVKALTVASVGAAGMGVLVDGEPCEAGAQVRFVLATCEVDLLATAFDE